jgi:hypothetical protein
MKKFTDDEIETLREAAKILLGQSEARPIPKAREKELMKQLLKTEPFSELKGLKNGKTVTEAVPYDMAKNATQELFRGDWCLNELCEFQSNAEAAAFTASWMYAYIMKNIVEAGATIHLYNCPDDDTRFSICTSADDEIFFSLKSMMLDHIFGENDDVELDAEDKENAADHVAALRKLADVIEKKIV